jgi:hypothetical protein
MHSSKDLDWLTQNKWIKWIWIWKRILQDLDNWFSGFGFFGLFKGHCDINNTKIIIYKPVS